MTTAPDMNPTTGLITLNMDGRFVNPHTGTSTSAPGPQSTPALVDGQQREEIFIHQSTFSSIMLNDKMMPFNDTKYPNTTAAIFKFFPAIKEYYGEDATVGMILNYSGDFSTEDYEQVTINTEQGTVVGDVAKGGLPTTVRIMASNGTTTEEVAAEWTFGSAMSFNMTIDNFVIYK